MTTQDHDHRRGHEEAHVHTEREFQPDEEPTAQALRATAIETLLIEHGVVTREEVTRVVVQTQKQSPEAGSRVVARAWRDADYRARLFADAKAAIIELGEDIPIEAPELYAVENTGKRRNVIVCTLCSCYPRALLGPPPDWYKSFAYRSRVVVEPRAVLQEFGTDVRDEVEVRVWDSTADMRFLVVPERPAGTEGWSEAQLAALVTRDSMIGVSDPLTAFPEPATAG